MIDLHSHVLPGIDDGPDDLAESLAFAEAAAVQGTTLLVATPHLRSDFPLVRVEEVADRCAELNERLPPAPDILVLPGAEVDIFWAQSASEDQLRLASLGQHGSDLLIETPYGLLPDHFEDMLFKINVRGYRILLAHPERNPTFQRDPGRLKELAGRGVLIQITLPSVVTRERGSRSRKLAFALVRDGLAHNMASDSHSSGNFRPPALRTGVRAFSDFAPAYAEWMVTDAAAAILEGEPLPRPPRTESVRRGIRLPGWRR
ncbi:MAG TPA: CpsB/CapC family capsule biosynthesis tyrosine phosphatase [Thermoleophilaceae bacterium]